MTSAISSVKPPAPPQATAVMTPSQASAAKPTSRVDTDGDHDGSTTHVAAPSSTRVTLSAAGLAAAAANKEAAETPSQTALEAQGSDMQAKHLLAREQAAAKP